MLLVKNLSIVARSLCGLISGACPRIHGYNMRIHNSCRDSLLAVVGIFAILPTGLVYAQVSGEWRVDSIVDARNCGEGQYSQTDIYQIEQIGSVLTVTEQDGSVYSGTISGTGFNWSGSYEEDGGVTTLQLQGNFSDNYLTMSGNSSFSFTSVEISCSGTSEITGEKLQDAEPPEPEPEPEPVRLSELHAHWPLYFGGDDLDKITAITIDSEQNIILAGDMSSAEVRWADSDNVRPAGLHGTGPLLKFSAQGEPLWSRFLNFGESQIVSIATDGYDNILLLTSTALIKLDSDGEMLWRNDFPGIRFSRIDGFLSPFYIFSGKWLATNVYNEITIVGRTNQPGLASGGYDVEFAAGSGYSRDDVFVIHLDENGNTLWSSYLGGVLQEMPQSIVVEPSGTIHVLGNSDSASGWPDSHQYFNAQLGTLANNSEEVSSGGACFLTSLTRLGEHLKTGFFASNCRAMALDIHGNLSIVGTSGSDWPAHLPANQGLGGFLNLSPTFAGQANGFVAKIATNANSLTWATYLNSGFGLDSPLGLAVNALGEIYVVGAAEHEDWRVRLEDPDDGNGFLVILSAAGKQMREVYLGGNGKDEAWDIALKRDGSALVIGATASPAWHRRPSSTNFTEDIYYRGGVDGFVVAIDQFGNKRKKSKLLFLLPLIEPQQP